MTPYELSLYAKDYIEQEKEKLEFEVYKAYLTAAWVSRWVWQKRIPKFEDIIRKRNKKMTPEQMFQQVKVLNAILGGNVVNANKGR